LDAEALIAGLPYAAALSDDLKSALRSAYNLGKNQNELRIDRLHLLLALIKEPRIRAHIEVGERDINQISSLIHHYIRELSPKASSTASGATQTPTFEPKLKDILDRAHVLCAHYRLPSIDIGQVFDLLRYDDDLRGLFSLSATGNQYHQDEHLQRIQGHFDNAQSEFRALHLRLDTVGEIATRLSLEAEQQKRELAETKAAGARATTSLRDVSSTVAELKQRFDTLEKELQRTNGYVTAVWDRIDKMSTSMSPFSSGNAGYGSPGYGAAGYGGQADPRYGGWTPGGGAYDPRFPADRTAAANDPRAPYGQAVQGSGTSTPVQAPYAQQQTAPPPSPYAQDPRLATDPYRAPQHSAAQPAPVRKRTWAEYWAGKPVEQPSQPQAQQQSYPAAQAGSYGQPSPQAGQAGALPPQAPGQSVAPSQMPLHTIPAPSQSVPPDLNRPAVVTTTAPPGPTGPAQETQQPAPAPTRPGTNGHGPHAPGANGGTPGSQSPSGSALPQHKPSGAPSVPAPQSKDPKPIT
jgi:hypothetical protein